MKKKKINRLNQQASQDLICWASNTEKQEKITSQTQQISTHINIIKTEENLLWRLLGDVDFYILNKKTFTVMFEKLFSVVCNELRLCEQFSLTCK